MTMYCTRVYKNRAWPTGNLIDAAGKRNIGCDATRVGLNSNFEFESAHEFLMNLNLNFVFSKSMNLNFVFSKSMNLNFVFSKSMNLNILIKQLTNFEFFDSNLTKQM